MIQIPKIMKSFCEVLWEYKAEQNLVYVYQDTIFTEFCGRWKDYDEVYNLYQEKYVYKTDLKSWEQFLSKKNLKEILEGQKTELHVFVRLYCVDHSVEWNEVFVEKVDSGTLLLAIRKVQNISQVPVAINTVDLKNNLQILDNTYVISEKERKKLQYLDRLPVACCVTRIVFHEDGKPKDLIYVYANQEYSRLYKVKDGELIGKMYFEFLEKADRRWLDYYYETAYYGTARVFEHYQPRLKRHLMVYTFQPEHGFCGCVIQDITERRFLRGELEKSREKLRRVLEVLTELVFQYDLESDKFILLKTNQEKRFSTMRTTDLFQRIARDGLLEDKYVESLENIIKSLRQGTHEISLDFRARKSAGKMFKWYKITFFDYIEATTHNRCVLGYLQDIDQTMSRQELLEKEAQTDALTGVLNTKAGKRCIKEKIARHNTMYYNVMFVIDIDDFKKVNDTEGHMMGDKVLQEFSWILQTTFRSEDIIYRLGGDEFVVFMENVDNPNKNIEGIMRRFFQKLAQKNKSKLPVTCSVGIYASNRKCDFEDYYARADEALYQTKRKGKNGYTLQVNEEQ